MSELPAELVDIVEPAQVATQASPVWLIIVIAIVLLVSVLAVMRWWLHGKARRRTLRRLRQFRVEFATGRVSPRALAYAVAVELRTCLQTHRVSTNPPATVRSDAQRTAWCSFVARLDLLRYQPGSDLEPEQVSALLRDAAHWVRRAR